MTKTSFQFSEQELPSSSFSCGPGQGLAAVRNARLYETFFERSHRAPDISFDGLYKQTTENLRALLQIPPDYTLLFFPRRGYIRIRQRGVEFGQRQYYRGSHRCI